MTTIQRAKRILTVIGVFLGALLLLATQKSSISHGGAPSKR